MGIRSAGNTCFTGWLNRCKTAFFAKKLVFWELAGFAILRLVVSPGFARTLTERLGSLVRGVVAGDKVENNNQMAPASVKPLHAVF